MLKATRRVDGIVVRHRPDPRPAEPVHSCTSPWTVSHLQTKSAIIVLVNGAYEGRGIEDTGYLLESVLSLFKIPLTCSHSRRCHASHLPEVPLPAEALCSRARSREYGCALFEQGDARKRQRARRRICTTNRSPSTPWSREHGSSSIFECWRRWRWLSGNAGSLASPRRRRVASRCHVLCRLVGHFLWMV